ncbi:MAG: hypothetical protein JNL99_01920 [Zoogloea sp.]|nr:hypothetical protein [Zoogloea sp.]
MTGAIYRKADRLGLLRIAQGLLYTKGADVKEQHATCWCHRGLNSGEAAGVWRTTDGSNARLSGVVTCGNVWACPVCAAKICEERRKDLSDAMAAAVSMGKTGYLLTLTFPHEADIPLGELLEKFGTARQKWANSRTYKRIMGEKGNGGEIGRLGSVTSLEVTVGKANGWHPHVHVLVIADRLGFGEGDPVNPAGDLASILIEELKGAWVKALQKAGLCDTHQVSDTFAHGLNVRGGERAAEYIAKFGRDERWGASSEITKGHAKVGTVGEIAGDMHFTPFQLLDFAHQGNTWARARFAEYVAAFHGRRMLSWSPGLRKSIALGDERDDADLAADQTPAPEETMVATITADDLSVLTSRAMLADFHRYVAEWCVCTESAQADVNDYLAWVRTLPKAGRGLVTVKGAFDGRRRAIETQEAA